MGAYETGKIFGAIFIAALPTAYVCYTVCSKKYENKLVAVWGSIGCAIAGFTGGLVLALPSLGAFVLIAKFMGKYPAEEKNSDAKIVQLRKLHELKDQGLITAEDYEKEKIKVLAS